MGITFLYRQKSFAVAPRQSSTGCSSRVVLPLSRRPRASCPAFSHLSRELRREALLLRPLVVVRRRVLLQDLEVLGHKVLAAVVADGHLLLGLDGRAVLVNLHASAGRVGLLVLAGDAVFLRDRHGDGECVCVWAFENAYE